VQFHNLIANISGTSIGKRRCKLQRLPKHCHIAWCTLVHKRRK